MQKHGKCERPLPDRVMPSVQGKLLDFMLSVEARLPYAFMFTGWTQSCDLLWEYIISTCSKTDFSCWQYAHLSVLLSTTTLHCLPCLRCTLLLCRKQNRCRRWSLDVQYVANIFLGKIDTVYNFVFFCQLCH